MRSSQSIAVNGKSIDTANVFNINGNNYFRVRDLAELLGFSVDYDASTNTVILKSA